MNKRNNRQFGPFWWVKPALALLMGLVILVACGGSNAVSDQGDVVFEVHPTTEVQHVDMTLSWTNSMNIDAAEGGSTPGSYLRVVNKTGVVFEKAELMYLAGGVLKEFSPMELEFSLENMLLDESIVNGLFIKLTASDGATSSCVIHGFEGNKALLSCSGFSAP